MFREGVGRVGISTDVSVTSESVGADAGRAAPSAGNLSVSPGVAAVSTTLIDMSEVLVKMLIEMSKVLVNVVRVGTRGNSQSVNNTNLEKSKINMSRSPVLRYLIIVLKDDDGVEVLVRWRRSRREVFRHLALAWGSGALGSPPGCAMLRSMLQQ